MEWILHIQSLLFICSLVRTSCRHPLVASVSSLCDSGPHADTLCIHPCVFMVGVDWGAVKADLHPATARVTFRGRKPLDQHPPPFPQLMPPLRQKWYQSGPVKSSIDTRVKDLQRKGLLACCKANPSWHADA
eukprot:1156878-Pelagomonas_calceolata.AAC.1